LFLGPIKVLQNLDLHYPPLQPILAHPAIIILFHFLKKEEEEEEEEEELHKHIKR
jgi:hypothetical protein